jgi:hypothetical protein
MDFIADAICDQALTRACAVGASPIAIKGKEETSGKSKKYNLGSRI